MAQTRTPPQRAVFGYYFNGVYTNNPIIYVPTDRIYLVLKEYLFSDVMPHTEYSNYLQDDDHQIQCYRDLHEYLFLEEDTANAAKVQRLSSDTLTIAECKKRVLRWINQAAYGYDDVDQWEIIEFVEEIRDKQYFHGAIKPTVRIDLVQVSNSKDDILSW